MKKLCGLLFFWLSSTVLALNAEDITQHLQQQMQITGQFKQQRYLRGMTVPINASGEFRFQKNGTLVWKMEKPFVSELHISDEGIEQTYGDNQIPAAGTPGMNRAQVKLLLALLQGNTKVLHDYFDIHATGTRSDWRLYLVPKTALLQQVFHDITVRGGQYIQEVVLRETQGDSTIIDFSGQKASAQSQ